METNEVAVENAATKYIAGWKGEPDDWEDTLDDKLPGFTITGLREAVDMFYGPDHPIRIRSYESSLNIVVPLPNIKVGRLEFSNVAWVIRMYWSMGRSKLRTPSSTVEDSGEHRHLWSDGVYEKLHPHTDGSGSYICTDLDPKCRYYLLDGNCTAALADAIGAANTVTIGGMRDNDIVVTCDRCDNTANTDNGPCRTCQSFLCLDHRIRCFHCNSVICQGHARQKQLGPNLRTVCIPCEERTHYCERCDRTFSTRRMCTSCKKPICHRCAEQCYYRSQHYKDSGLQCPSCSIFVYGKRVCHLHINHAEQAHKAAKARRATIDRSINISSGGRQCRQPYCISKLPGAAPLTERDFRRDDRTKTGWAYDCEDCKRYNYNNYRFRNRRGFERLLERANSTVQGDTSTDEVTITFASATA